ncbi:uncharacterized protein EI90DRAFT_3124631 [Cantharellus anzutake]|uniref:uncharacterized protein n=1 Tax=Cantharellus anzutake TaxID=1750568 RepID=UPI0019089A29|nr:uncharacterized protein EI90DRAFT_3124631 [Cantharellus anzutake]KAF8330169.1 hypothetical protein EI90DRAFT_3124631 [Cantharellus anzutake]
MPVRRSRSLALKHRIWAFMDEETHLHLTTEATWFTDPELSQYILSGTGMPLPAVHESGSPGAMAATGASTPPSMPDGPSLPNTIPMNTQDLITENSFQGMDAGALQQPNAVDWEDENEDADADDYDYHCIIGRIVDALEAIDLESA